MSEPLRVFTEHIATRAGSSTPPVELKLVLPFEQRQKARQRARLTSGTEVGIQVPRGTVLRGGHRLRASDGTLLEIVAAPEPVSTVWSRDLRQLALVAYHLGNRHVALEVGTGWVRYLTDHVLDAMVTQLGFTVNHDHQPFEPETGAYGAHEHGPRHLEAHRRHEHHDHDHRDGVKEHRVIFGGVRHSSHGHEQ